LLTFVSLMAKLTINQKFGILDNLTKMVVTNQTPSLIVTGDGGLGKTHSILSTIKSSHLSEEGWIHFKGFSTPRGLYNTLYDNNGKLIVFDDCDSVLEDKTSINVLKSALDSYETRSISWLAKMTKSDEYPQQFNFVGRIIFISNRPKNSIDDAILSRSLTVDLTMTPDEKISRMRHILPKILSDHTLANKTKALDYLEQNKTNPQINLRTLIMVTKMIKSNPRNWQMMADYMINN